MSDVRTLSLVVFWVCIATYGDVQFKAARGILSAEFAIGLACYCCTALVAVATLHRQSWGWIILLWNCLSLALSLVLSVGLYHEPMTWRRGAAGALLLAAILLTE